MSAIMPHSLFYEGETYDIVRISADGLFDPQQFGITTATLHTGAYHGFVCEYSVTDETLLLSSLQICAKDGIYPLINEIRPYPSWPDFSSEELKDQELEFYAESETRDSRGKLAWRFDSNASASYDDIEMRIPYTGKLRIGRDADAKYHRVIMMRKPDWLHRKVLDLKFLGGHLESVTDLSSEMAKTRELQPTAEECRVADFGPIPSPENRQETIERLSKEAEHGDSDALLFLGILYEAGKGGRSDMLQAYKWYMLAADRGVEGARDEAKALAAQMSPSEYKAACTLYREFKNN